MVDIISAVIVKQPKGYTACLRFSVPEHDVILSNIDEEFLYRLIEGHCYKAGVR